MIELAEPCDTLSLVDLIDLDSGEPVNARVFIQRESGEVSQDRTKMRLRYKRNASKPWLVCALCGRAVILMSRMNRLWYFRHMWEEEGNCPIDTRGARSQDQINAAKYNGAKESLAHIHLKELLAESIRADRRLTEPQLERVWRGETFATRSQWRKPDVQSSWGGKRLAFEIQLSTTFLHVIVDRSEFYRSEGASLLWLFESFDPSKTRRAEEDIFYNNNRCVFIVSQETLSRSREAGKLALDCWYAKPIRRGREVHSEWFNTPVFIDDLRFDLEHQRVYLLDYDRAHAELQQEIRDETAMKSRTKLVTDFEEFWRRFGGDDTPESRDLWQGLRSRLIGAGVTSSLPMTHWHNPFNGVVSIMLSAKYGTPVGYKNKSLLEVANVAFNSYKPYIKPFGYTLRSFGFQQLLDQQDKKGRWRAKRMEIREGLVSGAAAYEQSNEFHSLIGLLIPEISSYLNIEPAEPS